MAFQSIPALFNWIYNDEGNFVKSRWHTGEINVSDCPIKASRWHLSAHSGSKTEQTLSFFSSCSGDLNLVPALSDNLDWFFDPFSLRHLCLKESPNFKNNPFWASTATNIQCHIECGTVKDQSYSINKKMVNVLMQIFKNYVSGLQTSLSFQGKS